MYESVVLIYSANGQEAGTSPRVRRYIKLHFLRLPPNPAQTVPWQDADRLRHRQRLRAFRQQPPDGTAALPRWRPTKTLGLAYIKTTLKTLRRWADQKYLHANRENDGSPATRAPN